MLTHNTSAHNIASNFGGRGGEEDAVRNVRMARSHSKRAVWKNFTLAYGVYGLVIQIKCKIVTLCDTLLNVPRSRRVLPGFEPTHVIECTRTLPHEVGQREPPSFHRVCTTDP